MHRIFQRFAHTVVASAELNEHLNTAYYVLSPVLLGGGQSTLAVQLLHFNRKTRDATSKVTR